MSIFQDAASGALDFQRLQNYRASNPRVLEEFCPQGLTVLSTAVKAGRIDVVTLLLNNRANVNQADNSGRTPLWFASELGTPGAHHIVRQLLSNGANVDAQASDARRHTPLMNAIERRNIAVVDLLLTARASIGSIRNHENKTAQDMANDGRNQAIIDAIAYAIASANSHNENVNNCLNYMQTFIQHDKTDLIRFYPGDLSMVLRPVAQRGARLANYISSLERRRDGSISETATAASLLALYDLALLLDDSFSMRSQEGGRRIQTLRNTVRLIARVFSLAAEPERGILAIRWLNSNDQANNVTEEAAKKIVDEHLYRGGTRIGSMLRSKILRPLVYDAVYTMQKPLLIMVITDGEVDGERPALLETVIKQSIETVKSPTFTKGPHAIAFQFSRIGNSQGSKELLQRLDSDDPVTKYYVDSQKVDIDLDAMLAHETHGPVAVLTLVKLLVGAIYRGWDERNLEEET